MRRPNRSELRAATWALGATVACGRQLRAGKVDEVRLRTAAALPSAGEVAVRAILRRLPGTCLTRALVLQAWKADHGEPLDVVIGVTAPSTGFAAHAWLDDSIRDGAGFHPLHRLPPPVRT